MRPSFSYSPFRFLLAFALLAVLSACAGDKDKDELPPDEPVEVLYTKASDAMAQGEYEDAAKNFAEVERQHPYSQWATRAQVMEAFAHYHALKYDDAIKTLDQCIELHPRSFEGLAGNHLAFSRYGLCERRGFESRLDQRSSGGFGNEYRALLRPATFVHRRDWTL